MVIVLLLVSIFFLAFYNGANDNLKGVATLYGSRVQSYRQALSLATWSTAAGAILSFFFAHRLIAAFSGKGLVPEAMLGTPIFLFAVAGGATLTLLLATLLGMPTSTTHALVGGLAGVALLGQPSLHWLGKLSSLFLLPLVLSPFAAIFLSGMLYALFAKLKQKLRLQKTACLCLEVQPATVLSANNHAVVGLAQSTSGLKADSAEACEASPAALPLIKFHIGATMQLLHTLSAGAVCFARALNDTPKIVALMLAASVMASPLSFVVVIFGVLLGGILSAKKVAHTMSFSITKLSELDGTVANLSTSFIVALGSFFGLPFSTTHVSCGSLFGAGLLNRQLIRKTVSQIWMMWILTIPIAALLSMTLYTLLQRI